MSKPILPGATIGILGSGQLGRMFTIAARRMGYRVHVLSPDDDTPTGQVADVEVQTSYHDLDAVADFARRVDVVTFEFENVPPEAIDTACRFAPVRPGGHVLHTVQQRVREKTFLRRAGLPVTPFAAISQPDDLDRAAGAAGLPGVLKTAAWGYDGKGQVTVHSPAELVDAWAALQHADAILEQFVSFDCELSVVGAADGRGNFVHYGPIVNTHHNHILDVSATPSDLSPDISAQAVEITREIFRQLEVVGVLCVEFFLTRDGRLLVNELAPRPHNSGHLTIDAHVTCQFEQQLRAVCGLPLGSTRQLQPAAMANLLGDCWSDGEPQWERVVAEPDVRLHLYGKREPRRGRKMGHLTALADTVQAATTRVRLARRQLSVGARTPSATPALTARCS